MTSSKTNGHQVSSLTDLLALPQPYEDVPVPEYGAGIHVRLNAVTGLKRAELADQNEKNEGSGARLRFVHDLIAASLGGDATAESVAELPAAVIDRLSKTALVMAGIGADAVDKAEEDLDTAPNVASG